ncbi:endonuclease/exonuclease/phosphatase family protein, partial [Streptomyces formicae]
MNDAMQLSLLTPQAPQHIASTTHVRLMLFNTQHAAPGRAYRQVEWVSGQEAADFAVFTEVSSGPGGLALSEALREHGYTSVIAPTTPGDYGTVIASRSAALHPVDSGVTFLPHRAPAATVTIGGQSVGLLGL